MDVPCKQGTQTQNDMQTLPAKLPSLEIHNHEKPKHATAFVTMLLVTMLLGSALGSEC